MDKKSKNPAIRFKGFTEDWTKTTLGNIADSFEYGLNAAAIKFDGINKYIRITDINDKTNNFNTNSLTSPGIDLEFADNFKLQEGDLLFARTGASVGKTYLYKTSDGLVYYAGFLIRARLSPINDSYFIFQNTLTDDYKKYIRITSQRSGQPGVNAQEYSEYKLIIPKPTEQKQIGTFFRNLDNLITLHQKKYDKLVILKKAMLVKMFPKKGALVPEIRFKGFSDDWEEKKLGDTIIDIVDNRGKNPQYYLSRGIPIIDNFMIKNDLYPDLKKATRFIDDNLFENFIRKYNELNDVLITLVGNSIGNITLFPDKKSVIIQNTLGLRFGNDKIFMFYHLLSLNKKLKNLNRGMAQPSIRQDELLGIDITTPINPKEEQKIGKYFQNLDNQIALHKTQLDKLNTIKKACFSKMFVAQG